MIPIIYRYTENSFEMSTAFVLTSIEILRNSTLIGSISDENLEQLAGNSKMARVKRGDTIWSQGEKLSFFCVIGAGFVKMVQSTASGQDITNEILEPSHCFGLLGALDGHGCPLSAKAVSDAVILKIPIQYFQNIYKADVFLKDRISIAATKRIRENQNLLKAFAIGKVEERIAAVLITLSNSYGVKSNNNVAISVPLTRQDVSEMTGTTVESTIRTLSKLQKIGVLETQKKIIVIKDIDYLQKLTSQL